MSDHDEMSPLGYFRRIVPSPTPKQEAAFDAHLDECAQCRENPFALCPEGRRLLTQP